jgi:alkylation response protein AidB-like acyl-CoA dehydrogenase
LDDVTPPGDLDALRSAIAALPDLEEDLRDEPATPDEEDEAVRRVVGTLPRARILRYVVPSAFGGPAQSVSSRAVCAVREALAFRSGLADVAFTMQGLGSAAVTMRGTDEQKAAWLPRVARGDAVAGLALTEPGAGSDLTAIATTARLDGDSYVLDGEKTLISNAGLASFYTLLARTSGDPRRGLTALIVEPRDPGFAVKERLRGLSPHPLGSLSLRGCRVPVSRRIGAEGDGLAIGLSVLDFYRPTVGAAAVGFARRALEEAKHHLTQRRQFGAPLSEQQGLRAMLADMAVEIEAAALLVDRAASAIDAAASAREAGSRRTARESAMAKYYATEAAQRVIDRAVQMHGGRGVVRGSVVERLYRDVRSLRIYEGASEIQKNIIARELLRAPEGPAR